MRTFWFSIPVAVLALVVAGGISAQPVNYAAGMTYTADPPLRTDWLGDAGGELTNGVKDWAWDPVTGWDGSVAVNPRSIVIDLASAKSDIGSVVVTVFVSISSAVPAQKQILVSGSSTSATTGFADWGEAVTEDTGAETNYTYTWAGGPVAARWVKLILESEVAGHHSLLSEIEVFKSEGTSAVGDEWMLYQ